MSQPIRIDWRTNLGLDTLVRDINSKPSSKPHVTDIDQGSLETSFKERRNSIDPSSGNYHDFRFKHRMFYKSNYRLLCCITLAQGFYYIQQWISIMYNDKNGYIKNQTCEYCGQELRMFEKIIFPRQCENNPKRRIVANRKLG